MGWFRTNLRWGAWCALVALACQICLSFAHVHAWAFGPRSATLSSPFSARLLVADRAPDRRPTAPVPSLPKQSHDRCPICSLISLAASSLVPAPPSLPLLTVVAGSAFSIAADGEHIISFSSLFRARAPPIA
jgi:hypothetical protein